MATNIVRAAARKLIRLHARFAKYFGRRESREHSLVYLKGLMLAEGRKSVEPIALKFSSGRDGKGAGPNEVVALQDFLTSSPWDYHDVQREIQAVFAEELVPSTSQWPIGTVGVIDETSFVKRGSESCGVQRQWCGRLGKKENCQVGVLLVGVTPAGSCLLDHQLYLPEGWANDHKRRKKTRVPKEIEFQPKGQIALGMHRRTVAAQHVRFDWITADEQYGRDGYFLTALEESNQKYVLEIPVTTLMWTGQDSGPVRYHRDSVKTAQALGGELPTSAWSCFKLREGAKGPLVFEFACLRVRSVRHGKCGPPIWLVIRRSLEPQPEVKYYVSNAGENTPLETMALVTGARWRVEEFIEEGKGNFGMSDYEARSWTSWHHHMALVALAHLFVTQTKLEVKKEIPELTLPMAVRLLKASFQQSHLTEEDALRITEYHLTRNRTAQQSHRKSWLRRHKRAKPKRLL